MFRVFITLCVLGVLCYFNALENPFVHDDVVFILQNPKVHQLSGMGEVFDKSSFAPQSIAVANSYYRPFLDIVYRLEYWFFGISPAGYHLFNIVLHLANAFLIFVFLCWLSKREILSALVAMFFLVHPVQTEAVACISGISNLLFAFFLLSSFLFYIRTADRGHFLSLGAQAWAYSSALILFGAALLCKEQAIVLPLLLLLYELCFPRVTGFNNLGWRLRLTGFLIVSGGYFLWRKIVIGGFLNSFVSNWGEFYLRLKSFPAMIMNHLQTVFLPMDLHYYRSYDILLPWVLPALSFALFILVCVLIWYILPKKSQPLFSFGLGWFFLTLLPTTSMIPLVHEYSLIAAFEHFLYLPLAGLLWSLFIGLDFLADQIFHKNSSSVKKVFGVVMIIACVILTQTQTKMWKSEIVLFKKAVKYENNMGRLHLLLAKAYHAAGDLSQAKRQYAITRDIMSRYLAKVRDPRVRPFYEGFLRESLLGLATSSQALGDYLQEQKYYKEVLVLTPADTAVLNNLGVVTIRLGQRQEALGYFNEALRIDSGFGPAQNNLKHLLEQKL